MKRQTTKIEKTVQHIEISGWDTFVSTITEIFSNQNGYVFRGHASDSWLLESTLDRKLKGLNTEFSNETAYEYIKEQILAKFRYSSRGLIANDSPSNDLEWWELGQHFGLWTPLLDWTRSPFVAAYFALSGAGEEGGNYCVWALHSKSVEDKAKKLGEVNKPEIEFYDPISSTNSRLLRQQGLFSISSNLLDVESWVKNNFESEEKITLYKFILKDIDAKQAVGTLDKMNINDSTLFPDLTGSANYTNKTIERDLLVKISE